MRGSSAMRAQPDRCGVVEQRAEQALALRKSPDPRDRVLGSMPSWTNSASPPDGPSTPSAAYRAPTSSRAGVDDAPQDGGQVQARRYQLVGAQQGPQPALGTHDLLCPVDQLAEQLVELQAGRSGKERANCSLWVGRPVGGSADMRRASLLGVGFRD